MAGPWDTPPTDEELQQAAKPQTKSVWDSPPTQEEMKSAGHEMVVSPWETFGTNYADTILPNLSDEAGAVVQVLQQAGAKAQKAVPGYREALPEALRMEERTDNSGKPLGLLDLYRIARGENRAINEAGDKQNPWAKRLGIATGIGASIPMAMASGGGAEAGSASKAAGAAKLTAQELWQLAKLGAKTGAKAGAKYGALAGIGGSQADLTSGEPGQYVKGAADIVTGALVGGGIGGLAGGVGPYASQYVVKPVANVVGKYLDKRSATSALKAAGYTKNDIRKLIANKGQEGMLQAGRDVRDVAVRPFRSVEGVSEKVTNARNAAGEALGKIRSRADELALESELPTGNQIAEDIQNQVLTETLNPSQRHLSPAIQNQVGEYAQIGEDKLLPSTLSEWRAKLNDTNAWGPNPSLPESYRRQIGEILKNKEEGVIGDVSKRIGEPQMMEDFLRQKRLYGSMANAAETSEKALAGEAANNAISSGDKSAGMLGALLGGVPGAAALSGVSKLSRKFGSSVLSSAAGGAGKALLTLAKADPAGLAKLVGEGPARALTKAASEGEHRFAAYNFVLQSLSPDYRNRVKDLDTRFADSPEQP